jgi:hypothetical protein
MERRRPGRPKAAVPRQPVCVRLPAPLHDALIRLAQARRTTITALIRDGVVRELLYSQNSKIDELTLS